MIFKANSNRFERKYFNICYRTYPENCLSFSREGDSLPAGTAVQAGG